MSKADRADDVLVQAVRPFEGLEGYKDATSPPFPVSRVRAADLTANGLVKEFVALAVKAAPTPENKMAEAPANKVRPPVRETKTI